MPLLHTQQGGVCTVCQGTGRTLTTHCYGSPLPTREEELISLGLLDFENGWWTRKYQPPRCIGSFAEVAAYLEAQLNA